MNSTVTTEAAVVAQLAQSALTPTQNANPLSTELLVFPDKGVVPLEKYADRPRRKRAEVQVDDAASFAAYVNHHAEPGTALFGRATLTGGSFEGIVDYHEGNAVLSADLEATAARAESRPAWGNHRVKYLLQATPEWTRWLTQNGQLLSQQQFAEFLEDNRADIQKPTALEMMEIATTLQMNTGVAFGSSVRLSNGQVQLSYVETVEQKAGQGGNMLVPTEFEVALQPFVGAPRYAVKARLRTKCVNRAVQFTYLLDRPHKVIETAFADARVGIEKLTGLRVNLGVVAQMGL
jgi:uncharacterized protein YfdQ (DUF2303 family)